VDFTAGLLALAVGIAFDWQRLLPKIGNQVAALCALAVGQAWLVGGQVGGWFDHAHTVSATTIGSTGHEFTRDVPTSAGETVIGVVVALGFLIWFLAAVPGMGLITTWLSSKAADKLTSVLIWAGVVFPPLVDAIPGNWGSFASWFVLNGAHIGLAISGWIL
jgi:hypothetical protein